MSSLGRNTVYSIDTSSLMDWHDRYYPVDIFPSIVKLMDQLIGEGRLVVAEMVREEIVVVASDGLQQWAKERKTIFDPTQNHLATALKIQGDFQGLKDRKARYEEADAYVIAVAQLRSATVITQERNVAELHRARRSHHIPDVCRDLGLGCINIIGMMRREGWSL